MRLVGVGYRGPLGRWLATKPAEVEFVEVTAEHFFHGGDDRLAALSADFPLAVHGLGLSLGTPGPLDGGTLASFKRVVDIAKPLWISEHVAYTRTGAVDLGHLCPIPYTRRSLDTMVDHAREVMDRCGRPLILENIASHLDMPAELAETDFLNLLCRRAGCGLLLDLTNLYINARNRRYDPLDWVRRLDAASVVQLHVVGYTEVGTSLEDHHAEAIQEDLMAFIHAALAYTTAVRGVIIERDLNFPATQSLQAELWRLKHGE